MSEVVFDVAGVTRRYGHRDHPVTALDDVTFRIHQGERLGIVGESGSGKTTLARLLAALDQPTAGTVDFRGERVSGRPERELAGLRAAVQLVFQDPRSSLNPRMRVRDIVTEPLRSRRLREAGVRVDSPGARLAELLEAVDLSPRLGDRYPHELSGGQRQRVAIARALAPRPSVLIADEPVSALDVSVRGQVLNLLNDLVGRYGLTLVFVSHDLGVVRHACDAVLVLRAGRIEEMGKTAQVYEAPQAAYTRALLEAVPTLRLD